MARFLKKIVLMLVPVLIFLIWLEVKARREDPDVLAIQSEVFYERADELEGLIFGSSHIKRAIDPAGLEPETATLALSAGHLRTGVGLLEQALEETQPRFVIFEFSLGYLDSWNNDDWQQRRKLRYYFGLPQRQQALKDHFILRNPLHRYLHPEPSQEDFNEYGFPLNLTEEKDDFREVDYDPQSILRLRSTRRKIRQHNRAIVPVFRSRNLALMHQAVAWCREREIHLILLSPPKYYVYNRLMLDVHRQVRQAFVDQYLDEAFVHFWDFAKWGENDPRLFYNVTHLNYEGAQLFTEMLDRRIQAILE